jgi:hypothetical protein
MPPASDQIKELDHRHRDGIDVTLLWNSRTDRVFTAVEDERLGERLEIPVVVVGAGAGPCAVLMIGARRQRAVHFPVSDRAAR